MSNCIERLVSSGFSRENAAEICKCYLSKKDEDGLECYVCSCETYLDRGIEQ